MTETIALLKTSLNEALTTVRETAKALRVKADADREALLALYASMRDTTRDLADLAHVCGETSDLFLEVSEETYRVTDTIEESLTGFDVIPECSYEKFYGYCAECGCELTTDDDIAYNDADEVICTDCADLLDAMIEMEEELDEDEDEETDEDEHPADCDCAECEFAETCDAPATDAPADPAE